MFINGPYNKIALQTGDSSAGCGVIVKRMVMMNIMPPPIVLKISIEFFK